MWVSLVGEVVRGNKKLNGVDVGDLRDRLRGGCESVVNAKSSACCDKRLSQWSRCDVNNFKLVLNLCMTLSVNDLPD